MSIYSTMESLLRNEFLSHYSVSIAPTVVISITTNNISFEIEDIASTKDLVIQANGTARFSNSSNQSISIINYDKYVSNLQPTTFQFGLKRCDMLLVGGNSFILGELKDSSNIIRHRSKAKKQLLISLQTLLSVPAINQFILSHHIKKCCYFNKQSPAPLSIQATNSFNRINQIISQNGVQMSNAKIQQLNFEYWEYLGNQRCNIQ